MGAKPPTKPAKLRRRGLARAGSLIETQLRKVSESRGFAVSRLLTHWPEIVGADLAELCRPVRAKYGRGSFGATLTVLTKGATAPILQARLPELQRRVNACYGYTAISRIKITQTAPEGFAEPKAAFTPAPKPKTPAPDIPALRTVKDPDLRAALSNLATQLPTSKDV